MSAAKSVGAEFALQRHQLTVSKSGSGSGTVSSVPAGISCGATCTANFDHGTVVTLTAAPGPNSKAVVWGSCPGTVNASNQCEVTMSAARTASASFSLETHQLTVTKSGSGTGTVTSAPAGISCGSTCAAGFDHGTVVKLAGAPGGGTRAAVWSGCGHVNGSNECEVTMSAAKEVTATFDLETHQLAVSKSGAGSGTIASAPAGIECGTTCSESSASFDHGTVVTLSASPSPGSFFVTWTGDCSGAGPCEVTMSAAKSVGAEFALQRHQLTVSKSGSGSGTVTSSPAGISCGATCTANFDHGTVVTLTAAPGPNSKAVVWGSCPGTVNASNQCEVTMSAARTASASFSLETHQLTVTKSGSGTGTVTSAPAGISCGSTCAAGFDHGTVVKLAGAPGGGTRAAVWSGCGHVNGSNECEVTMSAAKEVTATFDLETHQLAVSKSGAGSGTMASAPAGIECGTTCSESSASFDHGTVVTLSASPRLAPSSSPGPATAAAPGPAK